MSNEIDEALSWLGTIVHLARQHKNSLAFHVYVDKAEKSIRKALKTQQWQDISTAPNDGRPVFILQCGEVSVSPANGDWWRAGQGEQSSIQKWMNITPPKPPSEENE